MNALSLFIDKQTGNIILTVGDYLVQLTRGEWAKMIAKPPDAREHFKFLPDDTPVWK
jgi:hypothetical protein